MAMRANYLAHPVQAYALHCYTIHSAHRQRVSTCQRWCYLGLADLQERWSSQTQGGCTKLGLTCALCTACFTETTQTRHTTLQPKVLEAGTQPQSLVAHPSVGQQTHAHRLGRVSRAAAIHTHVQATLVVEAGRLWRHSLVAEGPGAPVWGSARAAGHAPVAAVLPVALGDSRRGHAGCTDPAHIHTQTPLVHSFARAWSTLWCRIRSKAQTPWPSHQLLLGIAAGVPLCPRVSSIHVPLACCGASGRPHMQLLNLRCVSMLQGAWSGKADLERMLYDRLSVSGSPFKLVTLHAQPVRAYGARPLSLPGTPPASWLRLLTGPATSHPNPHQRQPLLKLTKVLCSPSSPQAWTGRQPSDRVFSAPASPQCRTHSPVLCPSMICQLNAAGLWGTTHIRRTSESSRRKYK